MSSVTKDGEKPPAAYVSPKRRSQELDLDRLGEEHGYVLSADAFHLEGQRAPLLKLATDRRTILIPQPSDDPNDPLNWSKVKKHAVLIIISCCAFLPDNGSGTGAVALLQQVKEWHRSEDILNHSQVSNVFMVGAGGLFAVAFSTPFGRLPVMFWFTLTAVWTAAWCAGAHGFEDFMAARILNGFFSTAAQGVMDPRVLVFFFFFLALLDNQPADLLLLFC